jgi:hypothetical protein
MRIHELFQGDNQGRGVLINNTNGDKKVFFERTPIDWSLHLKGQFDAGLKACSHVRFSIYPIHTAPSQLTLC